MPPQNSEKRLPLRNLADPASPCISPDELGQNTTSGDYVLISYLASPFTMDTRNDYVLFATNNAPVDEYYWSVKDETANAVITSQHTEIGVFDWMPSYPSSYSVSVEIRVGGANTARLTLYQTVLPLLSLTDAIDYFNGELRRIAAEEGIPVIGDLQRIGREAAVFGERRTTEEVINGLWGYIFEAANATGRNGIPARLLAAVVYANALARDDRWRRLEIQAAYSEINKPGSFNLITVAGTGLGVCQIKAETAAMLLGAIPWREKPQDPEQRPAIDKAIHTDYTNLSAQIKADLFNLQRFPRSNIGLCAKLLARLKNRAHRWPNLTQQQLLGDAGVLKIIATEYAIGAVDTPRADAKPSTSGNKVCSLMRAPFLAPYFREHINYRASYANSALQEGNQSLEVADLKRDLVELGFWVAVDDQPAAVPSQIFDLHTEWAVREFQIYSKMNYVARELPTAEPATPITERLRRIPNLYRYAGPISGVVNAETRRRIEAWKANSWRSPVVITAWTMQNNVRQNINRANIWLHNTVNVPQPRMFVQDHSDYYAIPEQQREGGEAILGNGHIKLGDYYAWNIFGGPHSEPPNHTWQESEILPENFASRDLYIDPQAPPADANTLAQRSTFKVIRAVAEQECIGFFDSLNAYDNAFMSLGPCHWTLPIRFAGPPPRVKPGELCGYLAYLKEKAPDSYQKALRFFGVDIDRGWGVNGADLFQQDERKYVAEILIQQDDFTFAPLYQAGAPVADKQARLDYFRTWHWFYRFSTAGRTVEDFRRWMWCMARIRLRDIGDTPWPTAVNAPMVPVVGGGQRLARINEVYTSERAMALLLRWHVRKPSKVVNPNAQGVNDRPNLAGAFAQAQVSYQQATGNQLAGDPNTWGPGQAEEDALISGLFQELTQPVDPDNYTLVFNWPQWETRDNERGYRLEPSRLDPWAENWVDAQGNARIRRLKRDRDSFEFWNLQPNEL